MAEDAGARARVGTTLNDKWKLEKLLGVGGMGAVYAARHTRNGARAAVKVLHTDLARFAEVRERFLREGRAANAVEHPGVVQVIDDEQITTGPDAGTAYLVMQLLEGESLEDRIQRGPRLAEREFLELADAVLEVLAAAHARGIVHRDLKPENLFLAKDPAGGPPRWKVLDFGLARILDASVITRKGMAVGTPAYMSPEQAAGRREEVDGRADIFSLAATGFRALAGRRIHEADSPVELVLKMGNVPAPPMREAAPQLTEEGARVLDRALAFRREDRYPDAATMRADVQKALATLAAAAEPKTIVDVDAPTIVATPESMPRSARHEPTMELSVRDLEPSARGKAPPPPPPSAPRPPPSVPRGASGSRSSPPPPPPMRRPSFIPAVTALFLAGLVVKLALDANRPEPSADAGAAPAPSAPSATADANVEADANDEVELEDDDAAADALEILDASFDARAPERELLNPRLPRPREGRPPSSATPGGTAHPGVPRKRKGHPKSW